MPPVRSGERNETQEQERDSGPKTGTRSPDRRGFVDWLRHAFDRDPGLDADPDERPTKPGQAVRRFG